LNRQRNRQRGTPYDPTSRRALVFDGANVLRAVLDTLDERESGVIKMRFGLDDGQPRTLDEIGKVYGVTRERIREIESKTLAKLRWPGRTDQLALINGEKIVGTVDVRITGAETTHSDDDVVHCPQCHRRWWNPPTGGRRRKYCSNACRQAAYRARRAAGDQPASPEGDTNEPGE
jgi:hypothetical protein